MLERNREREEEEEVEVEVEEGFIHFPSFVSSLFFVSFPLLASPPLGHAPADRPNVFQTRTCQSGSRILVLDFDPVNSNETTIDSIILASMVVWVYVNRPPFWLLHSS